MSTLDIRFEVQQADGTVTRYGEVSLLTNGKGTLWYAHTKDYAGQPFLGKRCTFDPYVISGPADFAWNVTRWLAADERIVPGWRNHELCHECARDSDDDDTVPAIAEATVTPV